MSRYAEYTRVPVDRSKSEIEKTLARYGASHFGYMSDASRYMVMFEANGRRVRFTLPRPQKPNQSQNEQEERRLWRSLAMAIKSKLDIVQSGISTFELEMLPYTLLPSGQTLGEWAESNADALDAGRMPPMLPS